MCKYCQKLDFDHENHACAYPLNHDAYHINPTNKIVGDQFPLVELSFIHWMLRNVNFNGFFHWIFIKNLPTLVYPWKITQFVCCFDHHQPLGMRNSSSHWWQCQRLHCASWILQNPKLQEKTSWCAQQKNHSCTYMCSMLFFSVHRVSSNVAPCMRAHV
jgi:hypothetical protein